MFTFNKAVWLTLLFCLNTSSGFCSDRPPFPLPYRTTRITIDAATDDWPNSALHLSFTDSLSSAADANTSRWSLVWDLDHLWFLAVVTDHDIIHEHPESEGLSLYHWDSVELYIDANATFQNRMGENDFQIICTRSGAIATLHGDSMLGRIPSWSVPKSCFQGLDVTTATALTDSGYIIEGSIPLAGIGLGNARAGQTFGLDLTCNDWIEDHPRLPGLLMEVTNLAHLLEIPEGDESQVSIVDPDSLGWVGLTEWENKAYRPSSWRSGNDFGYPEKWGHIILVGGPGFIESMVIKWGAMRFAFVLGGLFLSLALLVDLNLRARYRQKMRELMIRVETAAPAVSGEQEPKAETTRDLPVIVSRALDHIQNNPAEPIRVSDLAEAAGVSVRTLQREFKLHLEGTPREIIVAMKLRHARELLLTGKWRVSEVADMTGFESPYNFSRRFKDYFAVTPSSIIP